MGVGDVRLGGQPTDWRTGTGVTRDNGEEGHRPRPQCQTRDTAAPQPRRPPPHRPGGGSAEGRAGPPAVMRSGGKPAAHHPAATNGTATGWAAVGQPGNHTAPTPAARRRARRTAPAAGSVRAPAPAQNGGARSEVCPRQGQTPSWPSVGRNFTKSTVQMSVSRSESTGATLPRLEFCMKRVRLCSRWNPLGGRTGRCFPAPWLRAIVSDDIFAIDTGIKAI